MSNVTYEQALTILSTYPGNTTQKWMEWNHAYDNVEPPPPPEALVNDQTLALYISNHYSGPPIPGQTE